MSRRKKKYQRKFNTAHSTIVSDEAYQWLLERLEEPPKVLPGLRKLFESESRIPLEKPKDKPHNWEFCTTYGCTNHW